MRAARTKRVTLGDGYEAVITAAPPRTAFRALAELLAIAGPALAGLITGAGVRVNDSTVVPWSIIAQTPTAAIEVLNGVLRQLGGLDGERLLHVADRLLVGHVTLTVPGGAPVSIEATEQLDALVPDVWAVVGLARAALELNLAPTSAGGGGAHPPAASAS